MKQTCIDIQNSNMNWRETDSPQFAAGVAPRSGLGLCALENAISREKETSKVWASTYMLLVDRTWKREKARKRWSNACACCTLQGSSAKLGATEEAVMAGKWKVYSCPSSTYNLCFWEVLLELEYFVYFPYIAGTTLEYHYLIWSNL